MKIESCQFLLFSKFSCHLVIFISENIFANSQNITALHKDLLEINLSITAYIEESKKRLEGLRLELARQATSSHKVVDILSQKCKSSHTHFLLTSSLCF